MLCLIRGSSIYNLYNFGVQTKPPLTTVEKNVLGQNNPQNIIRLKFLLNFDKHTPHYPTTSWYKVTKHNSTAFPYDDAAAGFLFFNIETVQDRIKFSQRNKSFHNMGCLFRKHYEVVIVVYDDFLCCHDNNRIIYWVL